MSGQVDRILADWISTTHARELKPRAQLVLRYLASHAGDTWTTWGRSENIAKALGFDSKLLRTEVAELESRGILSVTRRKSYMRWWFNHPAAPHMLGEWERIPAEHPSSSFGNRAVVRADFDRIRPVDNRPAEPVDSSVTEFRKRVTGSVSKRVTGSVSKRVTGSVSKRVTGSVSIRTPVEPPSEPPDEPDHLERPTHLAPVVVVYEDLAPAAGWEL